MRFAGILIAGTIAIYIRDLGHDFQLFWDDEKYVIANVAAKDMKGIGRL
jgi:hypothetical protein